VLCNALSFSIIATDAANRVIGTNETAQTQSYLTKRSMTRTSLSFEHVTNALAFFSSPLCANITGEALTVDGGFSRNYF
jgi:enoyl-[acyl-carrier-protein] reductase (NADH)